VPEPIHVLRRQVVVEVTPRSTEARKGGSAIKWEQKKTRIWRMLGVLLKSEGMALVKPGVGNKKYDCTIVGF